MNIWGYLIKVRKLLPYQFWKRSITYIIGKYNILFHLLAQKWIYLYFHIIRALCYSRTHLLIIKPFINFYTWTLALLDMPRKQNHGTDSVYKYRINIIKFNIIPYFTLKYLVIVKTPFKLKNRHVEKYKSTYFITKWTIQQLWYINNQSIFRSIFKLFW